MPRKHAKGDRLGQDFHDSGDLFAAPPGDRQGAAAHRGFVAGRGHILPPRPAGLAEFRDLVPVAEDIVKFGVSETGAQRRCVR